MESNTKLYPILLILCIIPLQASAYNHPDNLIRHKPGSSLSINENEGATGYIGFYLLDATGKYNLGFVNGTVTFNLPQNGSYILVNYRIIFEPNKIEYFPNLFSEGIDHFNISWIPKDTLYSVDGGRMGFTIGYYTSLTIQIVPNEEVTFSINIPVDNKYNGEEFSFEIGIGGFHYKMKNGEVFDDFNTAIKDQIKLVNNSIIYDGNEDNSFEFHSSIEISQRQYLWENNRLVILILLFTFCILLVLESISLYQRGTEYKLIVNKQNRKIRSSVIELFTFPFRRTITKPKVPFFELKSLRDVLLKIDTILRYFTILFAFGYYLKTENYINTSKWLFYTNIGLVLGVIGFDNYILKGYQHFKLSYLRREIFETENTQEGPLGYYGVSDNELNVLDEFDDNKFISISKSWTLIKTLLPLLFTEEWNSIISIIFNF